jgi:hypothetical protein
LSVTLSKARTEQRAEHIFNVSSSGVKGKGLAKFAAATRKGLIYIPSMIWYNIKYFKKWLAPLFSSILVTAFLVLIIKGDRKV